MEDVDWDLISSYAGLLGLASFSIYCGALASLPTSPNKRSATDKRSILQDDEVDEEDIPDRMSSSDAWMFPIIGSVVLFGLYMIVKYFGTEWINWVLGWYFSIAGVGSVWKFTVSIARFVVGKDRWRQFDRNRLLILKGPLEIISLSFRTPTLLLLPVGMLPSILYSYSAASRKSAFLTDLLALSFSHNALSILKLDSFQTGCILLSGLFFYDIYWVFGTEVMVKVATSLDIPIKLLWPKSMSFATERGFTMLGLGDVVIPGTFIALALRYDHARAQKTKTLFTKPYFFITMTAYITGLITAMTMVHTFDTAQPALLYLSPACILSFFATALARGELQDAWTWTDDPEQPQRTVEKAPLEPLAIPEILNGNNASQVLNGDVSCHADAEMTETGDEGAAEQQGDGTGEEKTKKKNKGRGRRKHN
ncbi:signal peptide peptidase-domain-containing protein [Melanogaster broomeanus]|nr:signal peptide peptidase-domain-containing protein [Melanogaster broomeanus]